MLSRAHRHAADRPGDAAAAGALGRALQAWEQWDAAHQAYSRAQALSPRTFDWHYLDAVILQRLARHDDAVTQLTEAVAIDGAYLPARARLAESLLETGDIARSRPLFDALLREAAAEPAACVGLGRIAAMEGRPAESIKYFERAVALFPELGAAHYALARAYRAAGRADEAQRALALHAKYGPGWPRIDDPVLAAVAALRDDPRALLQRGVAQAQRGSVDEAIATHEAALSADPSLAQAHANLVSLYGRAGKWQQAEEHYAAAVKAGVNNADVHYDYAVVLSLQQKWIPAAEAYRQAIAVNPLHVQARNNLGQLFERERQFEAAAREYRAAVDAQPSFRLARFNLGRMLIAMNRPDDAAGEIEKLLQPEDAETPRYVFALSAAHVRAGRVAEGRKWANEAKRLALVYGQTDLAAAIDRQLETLK